MNVETLGALECVVVPARKAVVDQIVVLMHGFGAPGEDLVGLAKVLAAPEGTMFVFPKAPLTFAELYGAPPSIEARAWWKLDLARIEQARNTGGIRDLTRERPEGIDAARAHVVGVLDALAKKHPAAKVVIGGFSQGAMLACDTALREDRAFAGLVLLSGTLLAEDEWTALFPKLAKVPVLQSHGTTDDVLPYAIATRLRDALRAAGVKVTWIDFEGGHGIVDEVLTSLAGFIRSA